MKKGLFILCLASVMLSACGAAKPPDPSATIVPSDTPTATITLTPSPTSTPTITPTASKTPLYPPEGLGPADFPANVDPLTGLKVADPTLLNRRPMLIKVANLPRYVRPQWGLSFADLVYEYYTEEGTTRFAVIFYGRDADTVGPVRSGRFIDAYLVRGYKAIFAFGFADPTEMIPFRQSDFADRMVVELPGTPFKRYDPNGSSLLTIATRDLSAYVTQKGIENGRQDLNGMFFKLEAPAGGQAVSQVFVHYSGSVFNRWDYDTASGKYLRFSDNADVFSTDEREWYVPCTDRLTKKPITFDNVVVLYVDHKPYSPGIYDIQLIGSGRGYAARDGKVYPVIWARDDYTSVLTLDTPAKTPFALKPGTTWFEVVGLNTVLDKTGPGWRFNHMMP